MAVWPKDDATSAIWLEELITVVLYCGDQFATAIWGIDFMDTGKSHVE